jgi:hypothetical protein
MDSYLPLECSMKILKTIACCAFGLSLFSALANSCETNLINQLHTNPNLKIVRILDTYTCDKENSCAVIFENDNRPYENSTVLAYLDENNKLNVSWVTVRDQSAFGWESAGKFVCSDIKTYLNADFSVANSIVIDISKETARDAIFCPFRKKFISYKTTCTK